MGLEGRHKREMAFARCFEGQIAKRKSPPEISTNSTVIVGVISLSAFPFPPRILLTSIGVVKPKVSWIGYINSK